MDSLRKSVDSRVDEFRISIKKVDLSEIDLSAFDEATKEDPFKEFGGTTTLPPPPRKQTASYTKQINSMQKKINTIWFQREENSNAILTNSKINQAILYVFLICISLFFGLRYLWYAVSWSIKVLKS